MADTAATGMEDMAAMEAMAVDTEVDTVAIIIAGRMAVTAVDTAADTAVDTVTAVMAVTVTAAMAVTVMATSTDLSSPGS